MTYRRISDFSVEKPEELRRDLQQFDREVGNAFRTLVVPLWSSRRLVSGDTVARIGELLLVDATSGNISVKLPKASVLGTAGGIRSFGLVLTTGSNEVTLRCVGGDTINRVPYLQVASTIGFTGTVIFDGLEYWFPTRPAE